MSIFFRWLNVSTTVGDGGDRNAGSAIWLVAASFAGCDPGPAGVWPPRLQFCRTGHGPARTRCQAAGAGDHRRPGRRGEAPVYRLKVSVDETRSYPGGKKYGQDNQHIQAHTPKNIDSPTQQVMNDLFHSHHLRKASGSSRLFWHKSAERRPKRAMQKGPSRL